MPECVETFLDRTAARPAVRGQTRRDKVGQNESVFDVHVVSQVLVGEEVDVVRGLLAADGPARWLRISAWTPGCSPRIRIGTRIALQTLEGLAEEGEGSVEASPGKGSPTALPSAKDSTVLQIPLNIYVAIRVTVEQYDRGTGQTLAGGSATGFTLFNEASATNYLVTNRHVVDPLFRGEPSKGVGGVRLRGYYQPNDNAVDPRSFDGVVAQPQFTFHPDESIDLAVVSGDVCWAEGASSPTGLGSMSRLHFSMLPNTRESRMLSAGEAIAMIGYPQIGGETGSRPILVSGIVASDPRFGAEVGAEALAHSVLCHSFSWGGMSGAPVVAHLEGVNETRLVGVNAGHIGMQGVTGGVLSHFVPVRLLLELLAAAGDEEAAALIAS
jgi:hypothetical protein